MSKLNTQVSDSMSDLVFEGDTNPSSEVVGFQFCNESRPVQLAPYVLNGPSDQRPFHDALISLQEHKSCSIPWETYRRRLSLIKSADLPTAQYGLEAPKRHAKSWSSNYGTHGWHRYVGRFPPHLVRSLLNHFGATSEDTVLDPFSGSGTTAVECRLLGIPAIGVEISPLSALMSRVKSRFPTETDTLLALQEELSDFYAEHWAQFLNSRAITEISHDDVMKRPGNMVEPFANYERWLTPQALLGTSIVVQFAATLSGYHREVVLVALSSRMRSIGNVDVDVVRAEYSKEPRTNVDVLGLVSAQLRKMANSIVRSAATHAGLIGQPESISIIEGDIRQVSFPDASVSHVITSPPYGVEAISYLRTHLLSFRCLKAFLDVDPYGFGDQVIGSEYGSGAIDGGDAFEVRELSPTYRSFFRHMNLRADKKLRTRTMMMMKFFEDMRVVTARLARWVRPGGQMAFVIGNNKIGDSIIPADVIMQEIFSELGFDTDRVLEHKLKSNNSNSQVPWQDRVIQNEFVLLLRRRNS